jgi:hypothetical protein
MKTNNKLRNQIVIPVLMCLSFFVQSQVLTFEKIYPTSKDRDAFDVLPTTDGGYIMAGTTTNAIVNDLDVYVVKTNNLGDTLWTKSYGGPKPETAYRMLATIDGNFFIIGSSQSYGGGDFDIYLLKIDPSGGLIWYKTYGGNGNDDGKEIEATADGNYIMTGTTYTTLSKSDAFLTKIDPLGNAIWTKYFGGPSDGIGNSVKLCLDGGFIMAGQTFSYGQGGGDAYLVRTNSIGDTIWTKTYGVPLCDEARYILANNDGSFTFCVRDSSTGAGDIDIQVIKTDANGAQLWNKVYGGTKKDTPKMIQGTADGGYIVAGHSRSFGWINPDMWLIKLNAAGDSSWTRHYGGPAHEHCYAARQTADGGYIAVGMTRSYSPHQQIMFLKLDQNGNLNLLSVPELADAISFKIYPNPSNGIIKIEASENKSPFAFKINNALGKEVSVGIINSYPDATGVIRLENFEPGIYFLSLLSEKGMATKKIMLE